jgi:hypothetical protein
LRPSRSHFWQARRTENNARTSGSKKLRGVEKMFEVGKFYRFKMWKPGKDGGEITEHVACKVVSVEFPLVKVVASGGNVIVNVASLAFVSAQEAE